MKQGSIIGLVVLVVIALVILAIAKPKKTIAPSNEQLLTTTTNPAQTTTSTTNTPSRMNQSSQPVAVFTTSMGTVRIQLFSDKAPKTVENFRKLASEGFYNGTRFHRIIKDFMVQGGDPQSKDVSKAALWGTGGPGYQFDDELYTGNSNEVGTISMANSGPNTNGSQFFINVANNSFLNGKHVVFGKVIEGMDIVTKMSQVQTGPNDRPTTDVVLESVSIQQV